MVKDSALKTTYSKFIPRFILISYGIPTGSPSEILPEAHFRIIPEKPSKTSSGAPSEIYLGVPSRI